MSPRARQPNLSPQVTALIERWVGPGKFPGMVAALGLPGRETQFIARGTDFLVIYLSDFVIIVYENKCPAQKF